MMHRLVASKPQSTSTVYSGFTIIELLVVMALFAIVAVMTTVNFVRPQNDASLDGIVLTILADIKAQQLRAMTGDAGSDGVTEPFGIYIQANQYTLFKDATYTAASPDNYVVSLDAGLTLSTTFTTNQLAFAKGSGDVNSFNAAANTITITNSGGRSKVLTINRYGAITET